MPNNNDNADLHTSKQFDAQYLEHVDLADSAPVASLGQGYQVKVVKREPFTVELAQRLLNLKECSFDRSLDNSWVVELMKCMKEGRFIPESVQFYVCEMGGEKFRLNGQHVSWARIELADADPVLSKKYNPLVTVVYVAVQNEIDMRMLYSNIDRSKMRSSAQVSNSYLYDTPEFKGVSKRVISALCYGLRGWLWGFTSGHGRRSVDEISYLLKTEHYETAMRVATFLAESPNGCQHIHRAPVYAAMFATFEKAKGDAAEFWAAVRDGNNLDLNDPRLKLLHMLHQHSVNAGQGGRSVKAKTTSGEEMYRWCICAWNHWRVGTVCKTIVAADGEHRPAIK